ncbi:MAG TPA: hypothetical protein PKK23_11455 [Nitrospirales bacterium]|nr:hypothetical protein [Nitrospiraceae bacterium]HNP29655.1 hypothetical protein [Nitrospirales bacterium]
MHFFPIKSPTVALSFSEEALCLVEIKKHWRKSSLRHIAKLPLSPGVLKLSSAKPNITNTDEFLTQLKALVKPYRHPLSIVLSLPDICARTSIFEFASLPTKKPEQTALVKWRFQQDLKLDTSQSRLTFGIYMPTSVKDFPALDNPEHVRVLGSAIRNEIVEQYENLCLEAALIPTSVGMSGLDIFDLYRPNIQDMLTAEYPSQASAPPVVMFLFMSHWGFSFLACQEGSPRFIRTKALAIKKTESHPQNLSPGSESDEFKETTEQREQVIDEPRFSTTRATDFEKNPYPSYTVMKVEKEILATLQYYFEMLALPATGPSPVHLFMATDLTHGACLMPPLDHIQRTLKASGGHEPQIRVTALSHASHFHLSNSHLARSNHEEAALPGYAGLMVA